MSEQQPEDEATNSQDAPEPDQSDDAQDEPGDITDDQLPEDLQPTEDNPLARHPVQTGDKDDQIGVDTEGGDAANPSANMTYGSDDDSGDSKDKPEEDAGSSSPEL